MEKADQLPNPSLVAVWTLAVWEREAQKLHSAGLDVLIGAQVKVASIMVGTASWFDSWEQNGGEEIWAQKTPQLELLGGAKYYLEAEHRGRAPSSGVRIGVQIHNTWLNPEVVNTYLWEKHQIRAHAQRLPEIQVCMFLPVS